MRHEAAGITSDGLPKRCAWAASTAPRPTCTRRGIRRRSWTVTVPIYRAQPGDENAAEWLVPGMLEDKVLACVKSLHQRPRSRLMPLADYAKAFVAECRRRAGRPGRRAARERRDAPARRAAQRLLPTWCRRTCS